MRLYRIDWRDSEPTAQQTDWATSLRDAERIARENVNAHITPVEVPTTKAGLVSFLKKHVWCDAGAAIATALGR